MSVPPPRSPDQNPSRLPPDPRFRFAGDPCGHRIVFHYPGPGEHFGTLYRLDALSPSERRFIGDVAAEAFDHACFSCWREAAELRESAEFAAPSDRLYQIEKEARSLLLHKRHYERWALLEEEPKEA